MIKHLLCKIAFRFNSIRSKPVILCIKKQKSLCVISCTHFKHFTKFFIRRVITIIIFCIKLKSIKCFINITFSTVIAPQRCHYMPYSMLSANLKGRNCGFKRLLVVYRRSAPNPHTACKNNGAIHFQMLTYQSIIHLFIIMIIIPVHLRNTFGN